jgi:hypothetical protein
MRMSSLLINPLVVNRANTLFGWHSDCGTTRIIIIYGTILVMRQSVNWNEKKDKNCTYDGKEDDNLIKAQIKSEI